MNKKGATLGNWLEASLLSIGFVILLAVVIVGMNGIYGQNYDGTFGLGSKATTESFEQLQGTLTTGVQEGEATFGDDGGLSISTMWALVKTTWNVIGDFITGGWIEDVGSLANIPTPFLVILRILYLVSITFILIKLLFKLKP